MVVEKGSSLVATELRPRTMYWVDVLGKNAEGMSVTERIHLFEQDWKGLKKGARIVPGDFAMGHMNRMLEVPPTPPAAAQKSSAKKSKSDRPRKKKSSEPKEEKKKDSTPSPKLTAGQRKARFSDVEARAIEDAGVREMKQKIHAVGTDEEQAQALRAYRKGVFDKMRALDGSIHDLIDQAEKAQR